MKADFFLSSKSFGICDHTAVCLTLDHRSEKKLTSWTLGYRAFQQQPLRYCALFLPLIVSRRREFIPEIGFRSNTIRCGIINRKIYVRIVHDSCAEVQKKKKTVTEVAHFNRNLTRDSCKRLFTFFKLQKKKWKGKR